MTAQTDPTAAAPSLTHDDLESPRALVLMLHGGAANGRRPVDGRSLSWQRSAAMMRSIRGELHDAGVAVSLLRFAVKGWNAGARGPAPVADARWALDELAGVHPGLPVVLLGHSMGGRTAVHVADHPSVVGVVGLAPWLTSGEPVGTLRGKTLRAAHGAADRITSARATASYVERARRAGADARFVDMGPLGHYMLRGAGRWNDVATALTLDVLEQTA